MKQKVAVITGGSSGIGLAIARTMIEHGLDVTLLGRNETTLQEAAAQLGGDIHWLRADVSKRVDVETAVHSIVDRTGSIDILINNAGSSGTVNTKLPLSEAEAIWDRITEVNLKGAFLMTTAVAPHLPRPGGRIINISSIAAFTGGSAAGSLAYAASKSGLHGLTFASARELSPEGITVNAIAPGVVAQTNFFNGGLTPEKLNYFLPYIPVGRAGQPQDIAAAAWFLVSPEAAYITGEIVNVNGGWSFGR